MQPGKPQGFGTVGEDSTPIFTLPGNPVSSYISFETFVLPAIRKLMGKRPYSRPTTRARLTHRCRRRPAGGSSCAAPTRSTAAARSSRRSAARGSHLIGDLAASNALIIVPEDVTSVVGGRAGAGSLLAGRGVLMADADATGRLTHVDESGAARMVDVSGKDVTARTATASGRVLVSAEVVALLRGERRTQGRHARRRPARRDHGRQADAALIPLCHPLSISGVTVDLTVADDSVDIMATVRTTDRTGVEMEALTAVSVAALTVVDMVKAVDKGAVITDVRVETKTGGKSGDWARSDREGDR